MGTTLRFRSWIPNNNSYLDKNKIPSPSGGFQVVEVNDNSIKLLLPKTYQFTDSINYNHQLPVTATLTFFFLENLWKYEMDIVFEGKEVKGIIKVKGIIHSNGIIKFEIIKMSNISYTENLPNLIFTLIKRAIHEDNHHSIKVDTLIKVLDERKFQHELILQNLAEEIKNIEYQAKLLKNSRNIYKDFKDFESMYLKARGIYTYYETYYKLFKPHINKKLLRSPQNVLKSLGIIYDEFKSKMESVKYKYSSIVTLIALFISFNILIDAKSHIKSFLEKNFYTIEILFMFLISILFVFLHNKLKGNILNKFPVLKEMMLNYFIYSINHGKKLQNDIVAFIASRVLKLAIFSFIFGIAIILTIAFAKNSIVALGIACLWCMIILLDYKLSQT